MHHLLDKNELQNQEIYFAPPEHQNDSMEGFADMLWQGDGIVWKNLFRHYLRALKDVFMLSIIKLPDDHLTIDDIPEPRLLGKALTAADGELYGQIESAFFNKEAIIALPGLLASRTSPIRRDELLSYLRAIHAVAVDVIADVYHQHQLIPQKYDFQHKDLLEKMIAELKTEMSQANNLDQQAAETLFMVTALMSQQLDLMQSYNLHLENVPRNRMFVLAEFPGLFIQKIEKSIFPDWYSASFLDDYKNSALWGYYGQHKSVCLEFKTKQVEDWVGIDLAAADSSAQEKDWRGWLTHRFGKIEYHNKFPEIDFFRSIGKLSVYDLKAQWYCNENGDESICGEHLAKDKQDAWRENYWKNFSKRSGTKLAEWRFEGESRLIIASGLTNYSDPDLRKLKYRFEDLNGIIFGMNTPQEEKHRIIRVIEQKCKATGRKDFTFYQAYYSKRTGTIEKYSMNLIKFS